MCDTMHKSRYNISKKKGFFSVNIFFNVPPVAITIAVQWISHQLVGGRVWPQRPIPRYRTLKTPPNINKTMYQIIRGISGCLSEAMATVSCAENLIRELSLNNLQLHAHPPRYVHVSFMKWIYTAEIKFSPSYDSSVIYDRFPRDP